MSKSRSIKIKIAEGFSIGNIIAAILSYHISHSISLVIIHGILGWFYVIYWCCTYSW